MDKTKKIMEKNHEVIDLMETIMAFLADRELKRELYHQEFDKLTNPKSPDEYDTAHMPVIEKLHGAYWDFAWIHTFMKVIHDEKKIQLSKKFIDIFTHMGDVARWDKDECESMINMNMAAMVRHYRKTLEEQEMSEIDTDITD